MAVALVEREELRRGAGQPGRHHGFGVRYGKVDQRPAREAQERFRLLPLRLRVAVEAALVYGVLHTLRESDFSSTVATGRPFRKKARSRQFSLLSE